MGAAEFYIFKADREARFPIRIAGASRLIVVTGAAFMRLLRSVAAFCGLPVWCHVLGGRARMLVLVVSVPATAVTVIFALVAVVRVAIVIMSRAPVAHPCSSGVGFVFVRRFACAPTDGRLAGGEEHEIGGEREPKHLASCY